MARSPKYPKAWLAHAQARQREMLTLLQALVEIESPSDHKAGVDQASQLVASWMRVLGGRVRWHRQKNFGDLLELRFAGRKSRGLRPVLLLGHLDTVWPLGTLAKMPVRKKAGKVFGPGVYDMKAGVVMAVTALRLLRDAGVPTPPVIVLLNSDEEVGSPCSRAITEKLAQECSAVFVLEPSQGPQGAYKTARKGVGRISASGGRRGRAQWRGL